MFIYALLVLLVGPLILILWPTRVVHKKNRPMKGGAVICCNHYMLFDPVIVGMHIIGRRLRFAAKIELSRNPIVRFIVWSTGSVFVDRGKPNIATLKKMIGVLKAGKVLLLFPEGHRNRNGEDGNLLALQNGAVMLSVKAGVPVVPAAFIRKPRAFRRNRLVYGEPLSFPELEGEVLTKEKLAAATERLAESMKGLLIKDNR